MTDFLPPDLPELEPAVSFDSARLIAEVRRGDDDAIGEAYRMTFGNPLGRVVLLHALASIGRIGAPRGPESADTANHLNGRGSAVLEIAGLAGFDPVAISAAGLTQTLEGAAHEHTSYGRQRHAGKPDVIFDDGFDGGADFADGSDGGDDVDAGRFSPDDGADGSADDGAN